MAKQKGTTTARFCRLMNERLFKDQEADALVRLGICLIVGVVLSMVIVMPLSMLSLGGIADIVIFLMCTGYIWMYLREVWQEAGGKIPEGWKGYVLMILPFLAVCAVGTVVALTGSVFLMASKRKEHDIEHST